MFYVFVSQCLKWWMSCQPTDEEAELMYDVLYGFEKNNKWMLQLKHAFTTLENWEYTEDSVTLAEAGIRSKGKDLKGSIAQLIAYVKVD